MTHWHQNAKVIKRLCKLISLRRRIGRHNINEGSSQAPAGRQRSQGPLKLRESPLRGSFGQKVFICHGLYAETFIRALLANSVIQSEWLEWLSYARKCAG